MLAPATKSSRQDLEPKIAAVTKDIKRKYLVKKLRNLALDNAKKAAQQPAVIQQQLSIADELAKIAKLKEQGVLSEAEFQQMKQELMKKL